MNALTARRPRAAWWTASAVLAGLVACGGSGSGSDDGPGPSVTLMADSASTPWRSGSIAFQLSPPMAPGDQMRCRIDQLPEADCATGSGGGRAAYQDLAPGPHTLQVSVGPPGAMTSRSVTWQLITPDVVVYGATPAGITAALAAARAGRDVVLAEPSRRLGGMMTGGLAKTDVGDAPVKPIGGIAAEFFERARQRERETGACATDSQCPSPYDFEPHVAGEVFSALLREQPRISVQRELPFLSVRKDGTRITGLTTARGELTARVFIDASYEGDLMAAGGVAFTLAREPRLRGDDVPPGDIESNAGFGQLALPYGLNVDPYRVPGQPSSGLIAFVEPAPLTWPPLGAADDRLMAYNYRLCVTDDPNNRIPFDRPVDFDPALYEGSARVAVAMAADGRKPLDELYFNPYRTVGSRTSGYYKYDLNGGSVFSTDMSALGWNQAYPLADSAGRRNIEAAYRRYIEGLLYFWRTDPRFGALNAKVARFGRCADEFVDNDHWPTQLYVREARRMLGEYVMNENDVMVNGRRPVLEDSIAMGGYVLDSHLRRITVARIKGADRVVSEGFRIVRHAGDPRYRIAYRSLLPRRGQADNLLDPVTLSATSMAYSSIRMEPTLMALGQAAGTAAAMAVEQSVALHDLDVPALQRRLEAAGQILR